MRPLSVAAVAQKTPIAPPETLPSTFVPHSTMGADDTRELGAAGKRVAAQCGTDMMPPAEVAVGRGAWALSKNFLDHRDAIYNLEVRPDDVWVLSFPKCGA